MVALEMISLGGTTGLLLIVPLKFSLSIYSQDFPQILIKILPLHCE
jgi:hypothetical protein